MSWTYTRWWILLVLIVSSITENEATIVQLPEGKIQGHILRSGNGRKYYAFQEIPYASPPIGKNRFMEPQEPKPWTGILNATRNTKMCMQNSDPPENLQITEDCLYLNVYTPTSLGVKPHALPVLFWIHGGAFLFESGTIEYYNPKYIMDYNIIVVTINYRIGAFGFLSTSDGAIPGNLGLKDQLQALKWVYKNIDRFGGDKEKITVMGASAGSMCAGYLQLSSKTQGLVKGYILVSGSPISPYAVQTELDLFAFSVARNLDNNFNSTDTSELVQLLRRTSATDILRASEVLIKNANNILLLTKSVTWVPTIEDKDYPNAVITKPMLESLENGEFNQVPILLSTALEEAIGLIRDKNELVQNAVEYDQNINLIVSPKLNVPAEEAFTAGEEYRNVYTNSTFQNDIGAFVKYLGEELFSTPSFHHAAVASAYVPVFFQQFSYNGGLAHNPTFNISGIKSVGHTEDLNYFFATRSTTEEDFEKFTTADQLTMKRLLTIFTNFVKCQHPAPVPDEILQDIHWPQVGQDKLQYLDFNTNLEIKENPKHYLQVRKIFCKYRRSPNLVF